MNDERSDEYSNRNTGINALAAAIVNQAYDDIVVSGIYLEMAKKGIEQYKHTSVGIYNAEKNYRDAVKFFGSPWQRMLADIDGKMFLEKAEKDIDAGVKEWLTDWYLTPIKKRKQLISNAGEDAERVREEIERRIDQIEGMPDGNDKTIVKMYFVNGKRMQRIMPMIGIPYGNAKKAKRKAFTKFFDMYLDGISDYSIFEIGGKND